MSIKCTQGSFDTSVIKVILWSFVHSDFWEACISKMAGRRAKRIEIWASGVGIQCTQGTDLFEVWTEFPCFVEEYKQNI